MDFSFGEKLNIGVSVVIENNCYKIYLPKYLYNQISMIKLINWVNQLNGEMDFKGNITLPLSVKPSDIYSSYYHFIE